LSNIRVTYTGFIAFAVSLLGSLTGLIFVIIVTRQLEPEDFGLWALIGSMVAYIAILHPIIGYWTTREIARGENVGKTSFLSSGLFSSSGFLIYSGIALYVSYTLGADWFVLMLASLLVPISFMNNTLSTICLGFKPQSNSYGTFAFEVGKLPVGFLLVYLFQLEIVGAILTIIVATSMRSIVLLIMAREKIIGEFQWHILKFWIRLSWLTLYQKSGSLLRRLDVLIISFVTGSFTGLAFWAASQAIANLAIHSGTMAQGLYPKLLAAGKKEFAEESLKRTLFLAIPILGASIIFAKPALHILNPLYIDAVYVVYFLSIAAFVNTIRSVFYKILRGYENVDTNKKATFRDYIKSKLFLVPTLDYIFTGSYLIILIIFLFLKSQDMSEIFIITIWSIIFLAVSIPITVFSIVIVKKEYKISLPFKEISKYSLVTIFTFLILWFLVDKTIIYHESVFDFLPEILPIMFLGACIYFGLIFVIDKPTRKLYKNIIKEIRKK